MKIHVSIILNDNSTFKALFSSIDYKSETQILITSNDKFVYRVKQVIGDVAFASPIVW